MNDLISREAAINALIAEGRNVDSRYLESERIIHESDAVEVISLLPSAQQWTPVSEGLPCRGEKVLVSTEKTVFSQVFNGIYKTPNRWIWEHRSIKKVTAWMPLPEPYKENEYDER